MGSSAPPMLDRRQNTVAVEIAWRWFFLVFTLTVFVGVVVVAQDALPLRPNELAALRSRNLLWITAAVLRILRRYQQVLESLLWVLAATVGGFWVLAGAALRVAQSQVWSARRFLALLLLRVAALTAGAAALVSCLAAILAAAQWRQPWGLSLALVSVFSIIVYLCWRWVSLFLAVLESAPSLGRGWETFASQLPRLAAAAAANSTLKWLAVVAATLPLAALLAAMPLRYWRLELVAGGVWVLALSCISGYFGARLRELLWSANSQNSPGA